MDATDSKDEQFNLIMKLAKSMSGSGWGDQYTWGLGEDEDKNSTKDMTEDELAHEREMLEEAKLLFEKKKKAAEKLRAKLKKEHDLVKAVRSELEVLVAKYGDMENSAALLADSLFEDEEAHEAG